MSKLATRTGFGAWCLWLVVQCGIVFTQLRAGEMGIHATASLLGGIILIGGGCIITWFLMRKPSRGLSIVLALLSAFLLWKFYVGEVFFSMHPELGGYTFAEAVSAWLSRHTASVARVLLWLPPLLLLTASVILYPLYCIIHEKD